MPYLPRLVVGGNYEGDLTLAECPLGGAFAYISAHAHICGFDKTDCPYRRELDTCSI